MPRIEGFRIQNYRALKDIIMGRIPPKWENDPLLPLTVVIGKNGAGKSTIFDAFGFLSDCLTMGVEEASYEKGRGGFEKLLSAGSNGPIHFELYYRESSAERPISYLLSIGKDSKGRPIVTEERLRQRKKGQKHGQPFSFLIIQNGKGQAWAGEESLEGEDDAKVEVELTDPRKLGIATLGALKEHPRITNFRNFIQNWYLSYFTPDAARSLPLAGPQKHLSRTGDNLGNVVQYLEKEHPKKFSKILERIAEKIPGIQSIDTKRTEDGRLLLRFNERGFEDPFFVQQMSDGTLKLFSYLILLEDPEPHPFLCIEEPENGLYHKLLDTLVQELRNHATGLKDSPQVFVTTHQPYLVDALLPEEVWILEKDNTGFSTIRRASENETVKGLVEEEIPLGSLWYSDYLEKGN